MDSEYDETFDWLGEIQKNEDYFYADELSRAKNKEHYDYIKNDLLAMQQNREVFQRSGIGATLVAGVVDPLNIAFFHPVFNTGIRAAWAAKSALGVTKESAKIGFLFGMGSEALRAPFDPFNTYAESITNVAGNTIFAGLLGGGTRGITNKFSNIVAKHKAKKNPDNKVNVNNYAVKDTIIEGLNKGGRFPDYVFHRSARNKDINKNGLTQGMAQTSNPMIDAGQGDVIYVFRKQDFPLEKFSGEVSKIKDYVPAKPVTAFHISELDPQGLSRVQQQGPVQVKSTNPQETDAPINTAFVRDEETIKLIEADFRLNQKFDVPLDKDPVMKGSTLKELAIDKINFFNKIIPSRRIHFGKYDGQEAPATVKDFNMQIAFNGSVSMEGRPVQSIDVMQQIYNAKGLEVEQYIDNLYMQEFYKTQGTGKIAGIDYVTPYQFAQDKLGKQLETKYFNDATRDYLKAMPSKEEFRAEIVELQILNGNPAWNSSYFANIPEYKRKGMDLYSTIL